MVSSQVPQITVLLYQPQELFNETGTSSSSQLFIFDSMNIFKIQDLHSMFLPWLALQGLAFGLP